MVARKHVLGLGFLLAVATSVPAYAQPSTPGQPYPACTKKVDPAESEAAHAKYLAGKVDYDEGNYEAAIAQFRQAYAKDCTKHDLLVIISRAYELKGDRPEAIRALETYLDRVPGSPDAAAHRTRIDNMKKQVQAAPPPPPPPPPTTPAGTGGSAGSTGASPSTSANATVAPGSEQQSHTIYPWLVVGGGIATAAVGIVLLATAPAMPSNCDSSTSKCTRRSPDQSQSDFENDQSVAGRAQGQPVIGAIVTGVGGALVVGGLVWYFLEPTSPKEATAKARLSPQLGPGYGGLALTGLF